MNTDAERRRWNNVAAVVIAAMRNDSDKRQKELAKLVGLSRHVFANIESGRRRIELSDLIMICRALHLDAVKVLNMVLRWYELEIAQGRGESEAVCQLAQLRKATSRRVSR
jgi:DNA-binding XRE family transcriptional regulator